ncbi:MAG: rRNA pseudouridine synthase [Calditrichaeota bacterium]|nr:rRNA pseudouridine synthase [Calditrichota bacterium]
MRLAKYLASAGIASRRAAEKLISARSVKVNGKIVTDPAFDVDDQDSIEYSGQIVKPISDSNLTYLALHKPLNVLSTMSPGKEEGACLTDLLPDIGRLYPVGRLDFNSSGLMLLTNDGDLTYLLTHPGHRVHKEYIIKLNRSLTEKDYNNLQKGVNVEGRIVEIDALKPHAGGKLLISIHEGRKRIIRKLFNKLNYKVTELKRVRIGSLTIGKLAIGRWRKLSSREIQLLKESVKRDK